MVDFKYADSFLGDSVDKQLHIEFDGGTITNEEIHSENFELSEGLCSSEQLRFGACESSSIKFRISNITTALKDKALTVTETLDGKTDVSFPFGQYKVYSDKPTADRRYRDITAYDAMYDILHAEVKEFPKTEAGDRYLLLSEDACEIVKKILRLNPFGEFLFQDENTRKRISENGFNHKLSRICEAVGIPRRSMHKLRKTYGTTLLDSKVAESIIMEQMGHSDIKTTRKYYYYSNQNRAEKLEQLNRVRIG